MLVVEWGRIVHGANRRRLSRGHHLSRYARLRAL
jgi:hypothetical protein